MPKDRGHWRHSLQFEFNLSYLGDVLLVIPMKYYWWSLCFSRKISVGRQVVEQIEQRQTGNADAIFKYIDASLLVEDRLLTDGFHEGYYVEVIIPHQEIAHGFHMRISPYPLAFGIVLVGYTLVFKRL